ncbi:type II secretion system protein [Massilia brevitalea]|uniref:type II secretion system protein n=1 Tax=Massilia brevitalea TaxID=442526 RepID=UPI002739C002|nr:type II secretion system protein [Massilia brevitalea]
MSAARHRGMAQARGFALLELAVAAVVFSLVAGVLLNRLVPYVGESEYVAAKQLIGSLRTGLAVRSARAVSQGGQGALLAVAQESPMNWLADRPKNYLGEYYSPNESELRKGNWYFDKANSTLVYLSASSKSFSAETPKFLRFKVELLRVPNPVNPEIRSEVTEGLDLVEIDSQPAAEVMN